PPIFFSTLPAPSRTYPLSLHDALPIWADALPRPGDRPGLGPDRRQSAGPPGAGPPALQEGTDLRGLRRHPRPEADGRQEVDQGGDRKSTRLNSSHLVISYAVFCLKKKK